jgi:hypothetical protein
MLPSMNQPGKNFLRRKWINPAIAHYASKFNRTWRQGHKIFLRDVGLLRPKNDSKISAYCFEKISLAH